MFFDIFYELCKKKGVSCKKAAEEIGLSNSITTKWKKTGATPSGETLDKVAKYFGVSTDFLLGKTNYRHVDLFPNPGGITAQSDENNKTPALTKKDERDISKDLEAIMADLEHSGDLMFDGDPMTTEARESMRNAIELGLKAVKLLNKETYTPKKYKKG